MIIDTDSYAASGIKAIYLPGGEPHVELPKDIEGPVHVFAKIRTFADFGLLLQVANALSQREIEPHLFMPYLPGARQDRVQEGFGLTPDIYSDPLSRYFSSVTCVDPHSEKAVKLYERYMDVRVLPLGPIIRNLIPAKPLVIGNERGFWSKGRIAVLAPDKGAVDRATEVAKAVKCDDVRFCTKERNPKSGWLETKDVPDFSKHCSHYERVLLADDICDGGATFVGIADRLHQPAYNLHLELFVTHGIFSKGFWPLNNFRDVYTTNSFYRGKSETIMHDMKQPTTNNIHGRHDRLNVHVIDLLPFYLESLTP